MAFSLFASCSSLSSPRLLKVNFSLLSEKKILISAVRKSSFLKDTGAIAELSSSHCLRNNRRINLFPGVFSLLKYFSKIVFLSIGGVLSATIADFRVYHISCAGLSFPNYIYIRLHLQNGITAMLQFSCIIALSYSVSCSRAYSYRCFSKD